MSSPFLSSGFDTSILQDGSQIIFAATLGSTDLQPGFPVKVDNDQNLVSENLEISDVNGLQSALTSIITNPFNGTLEVQNLITAYDSTPVDLNVFIAGTLSNLSDLNSDTQYITATLGQTTISSNLLTNDVKASQYQSQDGSIFIDMTTPGEVNVNATDFLFNGDPVLTTATGNFLKLDGTSAMTGNIDVGFQDIIDLDNIEAVTYNSQGPLLINGVDTSGFGSAGIAIGERFAFANINGLATGGIAIGRSADSSSNDAIAIGTGASAGFTNSIALGTGVAASTNNQCIIGNTSFSEIRTDSATCNLGNSSFPFQDVYSSGQIRGSTNSRLTNNIVSNAGAGATGSIATFTDASGKVIQNSGVDINTINSGPYLPLSGSTGMLGTLQMNSNNITDIGSINKTGTNILIGPGVQPNSINIGTPDNANNTPDSFVFGSPSSIDIRPYTTGIMNLGSVARRFNNIFLLNSLQGPSRSCLVDNVMSCSTAQTGGNLLSWSSSIVLKVAVDAGIAATNVFLKDGTRAMTGQLDFGGNDGINTNRWQSATVAGNCIWGSGTTISVPPGGSNIRNNYIGYNNNAVGFAINAIGNECHQLAGAGACNLIGSSIGVTGANSSGYGDTININGSNSVAIGTNVGCTGNNTYMIGAGATNSIANSMLLGSSSIANIRPNGTNLCDLGTTGAQYKDIYIGGIVKTANIDTQTATFMSIGNVTATQVVIGKTLGDVIISGELNTRQGFGAWYSSTAYLPSFTAGTARFIPPTTQTSGSLSQFTNASLGILTYTGAVARNCTISYNISFLTGPSLSSMTFFNSRNLSLVIGAGQARQFVQVNALNNATRICVSFTDNVVLAPGDTVQLAAICAASTAAVSFDFVSCNIRRMFE